MDLDETLRILREAKGDPARYRQGLTAQDRDNAGWQRDLSVSQDNVGNVLRDQGDLTGALEAYRASLVQVDIVDTRNLSPTCHGKLKTEHNVHECGSNPLGVAVRPVAGLFIRRWRRVRPRRRNQSSTTSSTRSSISLGL